MESLRFGEHHPLVERFFRIFLAYVERNSYYLIIYFLEASLIEYY
jgi:hypothetical protein